MTTYIWNQGDFLEELKSITDIEGINIASAYLSRYGANLISEICDCNQINQKSVNVFLSVEFTEKDSVKILKRLQEFATVFLVATPFMHSKVYEFHCNNELILFNGSANLTENGVSRNIEMMSKEKFVNSPLDSFWMKLKEQSILLNDEVLALYESIEELATYSSPYKREWNKIASIILDMKDKREVAEEKQEENYSLDGHFFNAYDYETVSKKWWKDSSKEAIKRRKIIQDKLLSIHEELSPVMKTLDLHHHPNPQNITSGIIPNEYNHGKVGWIGLRYGKEGNELNPFGKLKLSRRRGDKDPIEQFHKHACFQLAFVGDSVEMGFFHGTAYDGVDRFHVRDHWDSIKENIRGCYDALKGNGFTWNFFDSKQGKIHSYLAIDDASVDEFFAFYLSNDEDGLESLCMKRFKPDDQILKERETIIEEALKIYKILMPLYQAMTYRIPLGMR